MKPLIAILAIPSLCAAVAGPPAVADRPSSDPHGTFLLTAQAKYSYEGSCEIKCADGQCRLVCSSGFVYAGSDFEARLQAESSLRSQANGQGVVVEGTLRLTVKKEF
jgi:hypothetical protein